jgi:NADPH:quinone reductase-like Zn-dependent oxidoreductase
MNALIYKKFGDPSVLEWVDDWPLPVLSPKSVLIKSAGGGVNPKDVLLRRGKFSRTLARDPLPRVAGHDVAGEVVEIGTDVSHVSVGDVAFGMTNRFSGGVHTEFALLDAHEVAIAPAGISAVVASSIPLAAQTALIALRDQCKVVAGQRVLINRASGGVGHFAVQIAKALGAEVHAVCGPRHIDFVTSLGADAVYDYTATSAPTLASSFHSVFDVFGNLSRKHVASQLGARGVFVSTGPNLTTLRGELSARIGFNTRSRLVQVKSTTTDLNQIRGWVEAGRVTPHVENVYPVDHAHEAHRHIEGKHTTGKIVISF